MPSPVGSPYQVTLTHDTFVLVDIGVGAVSFDNQSDYRWRMAVARVDLTGLYDLHGGPRVWVAAGLPPSPRMTIANTLRSPPRSIDTGSAPW